MKTESDIVKAVIEQVMQRINGIVSQEPPDTARKPDGIINEVDEAVDAALEAHNQLVSLGLEKREEIIEAIRQAGIKNIELLARMEWEETGMGRYEHKLNKHRLAILKTPGVEDIRPEVFTGDHGITLVERLPYGVVGCITPSTAPSETVFHNSICLISGGNSVVVSPHPAAINTSIKAVQVINEAVTAAGGPANLVVCLKEATLQKAGQLIKHPKVNALVATGGEGVVKEVLSSGKKAIGAGPGNPPVVVDETANIEKAGKDIVAGASFENNLQCIGEKELLVVKSVADQLIREMVKNGAYLLDRKEDIDALTKLVTTSEGRMNKDYIGKNADFILKGIGIDVPDSVTLIIYEVPADHITVMEEFLMPLLPIIRVDNVDDAIELAICIEGGCRHTAIMHSKNVDYMTRFAQKIKTTIFVKNGPSYSGVGLGGEGFTAMTIAGPTGEGLTSPKSFTRLQRCVLVDGFNLRG